MAELKSTLTWSFSRDRLFHECRRAYFYNYYASWGGWNETADPFTRKAYILKNIQSIDAWIGDIVHQLIKWVIESTADGKKISYDDAASKAKALLKRTWEQSRSKGWMQNIKHNLNLLEHYYNREPSREELVPRLQKVVSSLHSFYRSGLPEKVSTLPREDILSVDVLDSFDFEGVKVFAVPDFSFREDGIYRLYDWKTGRPSEKDVWQLSCYVLYAFRRWKASPADVRIIPAYLSSESVSFNPVDAVPPEEITKFIRTSLEEMRGVLDDPLLNKADIRKCPRTDETWRCKNCKFQELCP